MLELVNFEVNVEGVVSDVVGDCVDQSITMWVCVTCKTRDHDVIIDPDAGAKLYDYLKNCTFDKPHAQDDASNNNARHDYAGQGPRVTIRPVRCLSACKSGCVIALQSPHKFGYIFEKCSVDDYAQGTSTLPDLTSLIHMYHSSPDGLLKKAVRPKSFQHNVRARIPALTFQGDES